ncbi:PREDICTED: major facilitator superfamily domain-containing protein 6-like isoform X1 [Branchiostoma belcheri]|uniref:Major facilitator superfamily domain-containing protein 6-like isoform X1 n=2 Tax=Branchiostoma belcheri TaxID=7741 RepID=A0A6P5A7R3_BRABE|nr:PREDICTED: major facilitator superfamily domain-containing protein 6-like isoform X1 [Branchiostoma belcheri]XP_019642283.1 PREDICTED: major facilitator superfamily domain-containing protein 6-like isoform X1 [Branchiostoma belcheri]XP_019642284.1 PREDICTED: major facilitator superfamily domain-containing protein 6-like isoform X1 [Branchiostoma belcheri]
MPPCAYVDGDLLIVKAVYFFFFSGMACVAPYMSIYMRHLGLLPSQTGVITATKNFTSAFIKPLLGSIADKTGRHKTVAILTVLTASALHFSLLFVPPVPSSSGPQTTQLERAKTQSWFSLTFWLVFWITFTSHGAQWSATSQVEAATYLITKKKDGSTYGQQRLWGSVGYGLLSLLSGVAMDTFTKSTLPDNPGNKTDYSVTFYMFLAFMLVSSGCLLVLDDWSTGPSVSFLKGMGSLLSQIHLVIFLFAVLLLGAQDGAGDTFMYWHLKDLGASQTVIGTNMFVRTVAEVPLFFVSGWFIDKIGHVWALQLSFLTFALNFLGYSFIRNPWWAVLIDVIHGYQAVTWTAATSYASMSAQGDLQAVAQGIVSATFYGLGYGVGNLVSGPVFHRYGAVVLFRSLTVFCLIGFFLFYLLYRCFGKKENPTDPGTDRGEDTVPMLVSDEDMPKPDAFLHGGSITTGAGETLGSLRLVRPQFEQPGNEIEQFSS